MMRSLQTWRSICWACCDWMNVFCGMMGTGISRKALDVFIYIFIYVRCHFKYHHYGCQIDCKKCKDIVISVDAFGTKSGYQALAFLSN